jgi:sugar lactone lactonase YvrE
MMSRFQPFSPSELTAVNEQRAFLAESPRWHPNAECLAWIDMVSGTLHGGLRTDTIQGDGYLGGLAASAHGWVVATRQELVRIGEGAPAILCRFPEADRLNDLAVDPSGRLVTTVVTGDTSRLVSVDLVTGERRTLVTGLALGNGVGWTLDGTSILIADSGGQLLRAPYEAQAGTCGSPVVIAQWTHGECPDGIYVDGDDLVWVALWDGGRVEALRQDGVLQHSIEVRTLRPTSVTGTPSGALVVTTASVGLDTNADPLAGLVLRSSGHVLSYRPTPFVALPA